MGLEDVSSAARDVAGCRTALADALSRRDTSIGHAFAAGWEIGAIAEAANLTAARVGEILGHPFERVGRPRAATPRVARQRADPS